jgi:hypothetical protein
MATAGDHVNGDGEVGPLVLNALVRGRVTVLGTHRLAGLAVVRS